jgi:hypothetical protein
MPTKKPRTNAQLLNEFMQKKRFTLFGWTTDVYTDENGHQLHEATFVYMGTPIVTSPNRWRTAAEAREDAAFFVLPLVTKALGPL